MKITAITKFKNGELYAALSRLGWTQSELARRSGLTPTEIGKVINMRRRPSQKTADAIQRSLGEAGEYLDVLEQWPESFEGIKSGAMVEETVDLHMKSLLLSDEARMLSSPNEVFNNEKRYAIDETLKDLSQNEKDVITLIFYESKSYEEISKELGIRSRERVRQIQAKALRKLRHPSRIQKLEPFHAPRSFSGRVNRKALVE